MADGDSVPRFARPFVALLIIARCASALFVWEPWPLTSFRLFSHLRVPEQTSWEATTVEAGGAELPYPLGGLPGFRGFGFTMTEFEAASEGRRDELCRTWVEAAPDLVGREATEVRLYLRRRDLSERDGDRSQPGARDLRFRCSPEGVTVAD